LSSDLQCTERHTAEVDGFDLFHPTIRLAG
jgi:hypothetical protein